MKLSRWTLGRIICLLVYLAGFCWIWASNFLYSSPYVAVLVLVVLTVLFLITFKLLQETKKQNDQFTLKNTNR